ncbi:MAG: YgjP-like metallopeptidase domain-containing protein, partial [Candidatus Omnitrophota bacterium]
MREFIYGQYKYKYEFLRQERKTLSLTVCPDMGIILRCPLHADDDRVDAFLKKKWKWLNKQLQFFKQFQKKSYNKEYVSGEGFIYLGRQYKLIVRRAKENDVTLS